MHSTGNATHGTSNGMQDGRHCGVSPMQCSPLFALPYAALLLGASYANDNSFSGRLSLLARASGLRNL